VSNALSESGMVSTHHYAPTLPPCWSHDELRRGCCSGTARLRVDECLCVLVRGAEQDKRGMCEAILRSVNQDFSNVKMGHTVSDPIHPPAPRGGF
jgi:hypothetical protein